jgi:hypothetical protein
MGFTARRQPCEDENDRPAPIQHEGRPMADTPTDMEAEAAVYILIGRVWLDKNEPEIQVHILLTAPDDDTAIREALNALAEDGYEEAEFDQIGTLTGMPDEEPHASAYQGATEGEVAIVTFVDENAPWTDAPDDDGEDADNVHPFEALKGWKGDA